MGFQSSYQGLHVFVLMDILEVLFEIEKCLGWEICVQEIYSHSFAHSETPTVREFEFITVGFIKS